MALKVKPQFMVALGAADVTARLRDRMMSLVVVDNPGGESDTLEIQLDDRDNEIESPRRGAVLTVAMGYEGEALYPMGQFTVDEVEPSGPPDILVIRAKAADMREGLKAQRSRVFRDTTIGDIVAEIAAEHGLKPAVAQALAGIAVAHRDQTNESDMHFLTRLGRDFDAVAAPKGGFLVFAPPSTGQNTAGETLEKVRLTRADLTSWRATTADREEHGSVRARYRDMGAARTRFATAGSGEPVKTLRPMHRDQATAQAAAEAALAKARRATNGVELVLPGRPAVLSQTPVELVDLRAEFLGDWVAGRVEHRMDFTGAGFATTINGARK